MYFSTKDFSSGSNDVDNSDPILAEHAQGSAAGTNENGEVADKPKKVKKMVWKRTYFVEYFYHAFASASLEMIMI